MDANPYSTPVNAPDPRTTPTPTRTVVRINPLQLGKILGISYALMSLLIIPFFVLIVIANPRAAGFSLGMVIMIPVFYGILGLIGGVVFGWIYNICAKLVGGIEVEVA
jgi:hypothetical protein